MTNINIKTCQSLELNNRNKLNVSLRRFAFKCTAIMHPDFKSTSVQVKLIQLLIWFYFHGHLVYTPDDMI